MRVGGAVLFVVALLSGCANEKQNEKAPVGGTATASAVDAGDADAGNGLETGSDKPVELTGAQAAAVEAMRALRQSLDRCRELKAHLLDLKEEQARGQELIVALTQAPPDAGWPAPPHQSATEAYLKKAGTALAKHCERGTIPWAFSVHANPDPAIEWSIGGYVSVSTGAFEKAANEAELAAMLAHALAHASSGETMSDYRVFEEKICLARALNESEKSGVTLDFNGLSLKGLSSDVLKTYAGATKDSQLIAGLDKTFRLKKTPSFASKDEIHADEAALKMLEAEGYDVDAYLPALQKLDANPLWAKAHPQSEERSSELDLGLSGWKRSHPKPKKPAPIPKELR